jgi:hypothetical protein
MSDYERGPYTPPAEAPLAFDPRRPVRGSGPVPVTLIISGLVLVGLVAAVVFVYRGGIRGPGAAPEPVGAPLSDIKAPAPADNANPDAANGLVITKSESGNATPVFTAPPEQPQDRSAPAAAAPAAAPAGPAPVTVLRPTAPDTGADAAPPPQPVRVASASPAPKPVKPAVAGVASESGAQATQPKAGWVQIGAFSSSALAEQGWNDVARLRPAKMAGKGKKVLPLDRDGKTLYRTFITGFASHDEAVSFCTDLVRLKQHCIVK